MTNMQRAKEFMDYIRFNFGDTELDSKFLMDYFKTQNNKENYMELLWMSLSFLDETDGEFKIYSNNPFNEDFEKAHNIAVKVLITIEELIDDSLFEFVPTEDLLYINNILFRAELFEKIKRNSDYKLTPYEAMKVIEIFKCADESRVLSETFTRNLNHFLTENSIKLYNKALETLNEMLKPDGYTIKALDDNTKSENCDTKSKKTAEKTDCVIIRSESSFKHSNFESCIRFRDKELEDIKDAYHKINDTFIDPISSKEIVKLMDDFLSKLKDHYPDVTLIQELNFNDYQIIFCGYNTISHDNGIQFINDKCSVIVKN